MCGRCGAQRVDSQLGLEASPALYVERMVAVFREVWRVLRSDGTVWLNLGDSYATGAGRNDTDDANLARRAAAFGTGMGVGTGPRTFTSMVHPTKPKDLVGIPWKVAFALQQPFYAGSIKCEADRAWLAAMIDGEGSIALNHLKPGESRSTSYYGTDMRVHNTSRAIIQRCADIAGVGSVRLGDSRGRIVYVWAVYGAEARSVLTEIYPHLVAKQHEARLAIGAQTAEGHAGLKALHSGSGSTFDVAAPASLYSPGWYLRSDIIWSKPNPMPESVSDRPTKAHEYLFLLAKQPRYYFDADAIREEREPDSLRRSELYGANPSDAKWNPDRNDGGRGGAMGFNGNPAGRNRRSVWQIPTQPYAEAHFATYPEALVRPCVLAGTSEHGGCAACGAPWQREVEREPSEPQRDRYAGKGHMGDHRCGGDRPGGFYPASQTTGWHPSCMCFRPCSECGSWLPSEATYCPYCEDVGSLEGEPTRPQTVLDPFIGSGTTALVARNHGRRCIGVDLSVEYLEIAARRLQQLSLFAVDPEAPPAPLRAQRGLSGGAYSPPGQTPHSNARGGSS